MEPDDPADAPGLGLVVRDVVGPEPVLVAPDVEQEHRQKAEGVEGELLDGDRAADDGDRDAQRGRPVLEGEEGVAEEDVQEEAEGDQAGQGEPEGFPLEAVVRVPQEPPGQHGDGDDEQRQAAGVSQRRGVDGDRHDGLRHPDRPQSEDGRDGHGQDDASDDLGVGPWRPTLARRGHGQGLLRFRVVLTPSHPGRGPPPLADRVPGQMGLTPSISKCTAGVPLTPPKSGRPRLLKRKLLFFSSWGPLSRPFNSLVASWRSMTPLSSGLSASTSELNPTRRP